MAKGISTKGIIDVMINQNVQHNLSKHRVLRNRVRKYSNGVMTKKVFIAKLIATYSRELLLNSLAAYAICNLLEISIWYMLVYVSLRLILLFNSIFNMFVDEAIKR